MVKQDAADREIRKLFHNSMKLKLTKMEINIAFLFIDPKVKLNNLINKIFRHLVSIIYCSLTVFFKSDENLDIWNF